MTDTTFWSELGWRQLTQQEREREYSPSSCVGYEIEPFLDEYASSSETSRLWCTNNGYSVSTLGYGFQQTQTIDVVVPRVGAAPLVVFIHGGYWQALSKHDAFGPAAEFAARGIAYAAVDYTLAPAATLDEIVEECRTALSYLHSQAGQLNIDGDRIVVAGSSAGAHLAAMVARDPDRTWEPAGLVLLSGIYEIEPLIGTSINDLLALDTAAAQRNSPARLPATTLARALIAWGDNETQQFKHQSQLFASSLTAAGTAVAQIEARGRNHFDIVEDLARAGTELGERVTALIESTRTDQRAT